MNTPLTRAEILVTLRAALEPLPYTHALWEGGAAAFGRVDDWSDIDLQVDADDSLTLKELNRRNDIEALAFYHAFTLRPLVEALRIKHSPTRHNFHTRYVYYDLPPEVVRKLEPLFFVANADELGAKRALAEAFFTETLETLDLSEVAKALKQ